MSWAEWNATMANELNSAGFRCRGFNEETRKWENNRNLYRADSSDPKIFNVSSTNSEQCKLCINSPLYIDTRLLWKQTIGSNGP